MRRAAALMMAAMMLWSLGCSHELQIKNLAMYQATFKVGAESARPKLGILPFDGTPEDLFFFNSIIERLNADRGTGDLRTDYVPRIAQNRPDQQRLFAPDLVLGIRPKVTYRSSGWNFLVNWPGFLIFTPAWNGYVYHADVLTTVTVHDSTGKELDQFAIPMSFNLRHAEMDRSIWAGLSWFEVSLLAFCSGIYFANSVDRDMIPPFQTHVKDAYTTYVMSQARSRIQSIAASTAPPEAVAPAPPEQVEPETRQDPPHPE